MRRFISTVLAFALSLAAGCTGPASQSPAAPDPAVPDSAAGYPDLRAELERVLAERGIKLDSEGQPLRSVSSVPNRDYQLPGRTNNILTGSAELEWAHYQTGDYDQNGEVNISDLTPVGIHFGKTSAAPDWFFAQAADGDGNGEVNISDISPIGQHFGTVVDGYVVQYRRQSQDPYADYGFVSFADGFDNGGRLEFGYTAPGNADFDSFRVSPVGAAREFDWTVYRLNLPGSMSTHPAVVSYLNRPLIVWQDWDNEDLMCSRATVNRPMSPADWTTSAIDSDRVQVEQAGLALINGEPAVVYCGFDNSSINEIRYARLLTAEPTGPADWDVSLITNGLPIQPLSLLEKDILPVVSLAGASGQLYLGVTPFLHPTGPADWTSISVNSGTTLTVPVACIAAERVQLASYGYGVSPGLNYATATALQPATTADFDNFPLLPIGTTLVRPSILTVGGYPHVCVPNEANGSLDYLRSGETTPNTAAVWFLHSLFIDPTDILAPQLSLLEGRPAVAFGRFDLNFAWSGTEQADAPADWLLSEELEGGLNFGVGPLDIAVTDYLPIIAFVHYDAPNNVRDIAIAVAVEQ